MPKASPEHARFLKACAKAELERTKRMGLRINKLSARDVKAQRDALIADIQRVFVHPDNPFKGFAASRARYRQLGHFGEVHVFDHFGTHEEFLRAAGLRDTRGTSTHKLAVARASTEQKVAQYANRHVLRWQGKFDRKLRERAGRGGEKIMVVLSDLHSHFLDPFAWSVACDVMKMIQPDVVCLNGDVTEFSAVSRHMRMPGSGSLSLQSEIDFTRTKILKVVRELCPDAVITWHIGNHEYRLVRYLADTAPELASLECLAFDKLFGIEEFGIEMVFGGNFLAPKIKRQKKEVQDNWKVYYDCYAVTHGTSCSVVPAHDQMKRYGMSGTSGHVHRPSHVFVPTLSCPTANWMSTGMMAGFAVGKDYVPEPSAWTMGFGVATICPERKVVIQVPVVMQAGFASFAGRVWRETPAAQEERLRLY